MTSNVIIRPAKANDVISFYGGYPEFKMVGYVAEKNGVIIGVGGVAYPRGIHIPVLFSDASEEMLSEKKACARACRILIDFINKLGIPVYATASNEIKTAPYLLAKLGFVPTGNLTEIGECLVRYPQGD